MVSKRVFVVIGSMLFGIGLLATFNAMQGITGFIVYESESNNNAYFFGAAFVIIGLMFMVRSKAYSSIWRESKTERLLKDLITGKTNTVSIELVLASIKRPTEYTLIKHPREPESQRSVTLQVKDPAQIRPEILVIDSFGPKKLLYFPHKTFEVPLQVKKIDGGSEEKIAIDWYSFLDKYRSEFEAENLSVETTCGVRIV